MALTDSHIIGFLATTQPDKARTFYCDALGLRLEEDNPAALILRTANAMLRIQKIRAFTPLPFTALGWEVPDIRAAMEQLRNKGVQFERYEGMKQDEFGVWTSPSRAKVCWFKDPDGNLLGLTQFA